jgi:protein O-mannosyl-transferase
MTRAKRSRKSLANAKSFKLGNTQPASATPAALPHWIFPVLLVFLTGVSFLTVLQNGLLTWDDEATLVNNFHYRGLGWPQIKWMFSTFYLGHYQPLSWVSFDLDYLVWGLDPLGYHLTSLILHALNAVIFYFIATRLLSLAVSPSFATLPIRLAAGFSALLFAIHPLRVESVAWATERRDVLSGLFFLLTILCYLKAITGEDKKRRRWLGVTLTVYFLSLLSKATGMTLPLVLLVLDVYPLRRLGAERGRWFGPAERKVWREKVPFLLLAIACGVVALLAQREAGALRTIERYDLAYRVAQAFFGVVFYLWKTLIPLSLSPLYEAPYYVDVTGPVLILSVVMVIGLSGLFWRLRSVWPAGWVSWLYYLLLLAPVLGIAQSGPQLVADRYSYLSCLSWAVLAGAGLLYLCSASKKDGITKKLFSVVVGVALIFSTALGVLTWRQVQVWHDSETLWRHVLSVTPKSSFAQNNLGNLAGKRGALDEAAQRFRAALELNPRLAEAHFNLGNLSYRQRRLDQALRDYLEAIRIRPRYAEAHYNLGVVLAKLGRYEEASKHYQEALQLNPDDAQSHNNLGNVLLMRGDLNAATEHYREALRIDPSLAEARQNLLELETHSRDLNYQRATN